MKRPSILTAAIVALLLSGCSAKQTAKETVRTVRVDTVASYGTEPSVTFPGKIKAASDVNLAFRVSGKIWKVNVDAGSYVRKGQVLAEIDPRDYEIQLAATEAEYNQIKREAGRVMELFETESVTPNEHDKAVYGLQQITAKYNAHKNALEDTRLTAPFDGYVQKRLFDSNEIVSAGMPVISMINAGVPEVEINIPSADFVQRDKFEGYSCTIDIFPGKTFPLELIGINQKANLNQLYTMRLRIKGIEKEMTPAPGMSAMVTIRYQPETSNRVAIPLVALLEIDNKSSVWVYNEQTQTVSTRRVKPYAILTDGTVVIEQGLSAGEVVVSAGVHALEEGEKVKLLPAVSTTNVGGML